ASDFVIVERRGIGQVREVPVHILPPAPDKFRLAQTALENPPQTPFHRFGFSVRSRPVKVQSQVDRDTLTLIAMRAAITGSVLPVPVTNLPLVSLTSPGDLQANLRSDTYGLGGEHSRSSMHPARRCWSCGR